MTKFNLTLFLLTVLFVRSSGQAISIPTNIPYESQFDSFRISVSNFCLSNKIIDSKSKVDIRIFRFQAFGDRKLIRIFSSGPDSLQLDIYSLFTYADSLIYHKTFLGKNTDSKLKALLTKYDILNLEDLNYSFISKNNLPVTNDGNQYYIEAKVESNFIYKEFDNPEMYLKIDKNKARQAQAFTAFITELEIYSNVKISNLEL